MSRPYSDHPNGSIVGANLHELLPVFFNSIYFILYLFRLHLRRAWNIAQKIVFSLKHAVLSML